MFPNFQIRDGVIKNMVSQCRAVFQVYYANEMDSCAAGHLIRLKLTFCRHPLTVIFNYKSFRICLRLSEPPSTHLSTANPCLVLLLVTNFDQKGSDSLGLVNQEQTSLVLELSSPHHGYPAKYSLHCPSHVVSLHLSQ